MKTTFKIEYDYPNQPKRTITHETDAVGLADLIENFEDFLRGAGFQLQGQYLGICDIEELRER